MKDDAVSKDPVGDEPVSDDMRPTYIRVVVFWLLSLAALYAFQQYFT